MNPARFIGRLFARLGLLLGPLSAGLCLVTAGPAAAQDDPPGRVGRLTELHGPVFRFDDEEGRWAEAERNRPLTGGDRLSTAAEGRAELRVGSTVLRLGAGTELEVVRLDDDRLVFQLHSGALALRVRSREVAAELEVLTAEARLLPLRAGHYRIDRMDDTTLAGAWRGDLRVDDGPGFVVATGQRVELYREGRPSTLRRAASRLPDDTFAAWVLRDDQRDERSAAARYVSPEMTGAEDLDREGTWDQSPEFGAVWFPTEVRAGWVPYRDGRWVWVRPWGWTWVDEARWGFAPFHYGRWIFWRGRWGWSPGNYVARPVYAPALVAWVGGGQWSVSLNLGGPAVGWVPLAPREVYVPHYRVSPGYQERVNPHWRLPPGRKPPAPHRGQETPLVYGNQAVPGAVTVVPRDVLLRREPVARAVVVVPDAHRAPAAGQLPPELLGGLPRGRPQGGPGLSTGAPVGLPPPAARGVPDRVERPARPDPGERSERVVRPGRVEAPERVERRERIEPERGGRWERGDRRRPSPGVAPAPAPATAPAQPAVPAPVQPATPPRQAQPPHAATPPAATPPAAAPPARPQPTPRRDDDESRKRGPGGVRGTDREREAAK